MRFTESGATTYLANLYNSGQVWINADRVTANYISLLFLNGAPQLAYGVPYNAKSTYGYRSSDTGIFVAMPEYPIQEMRMLCGTAPTTSVEIDPEV